MARTKKPKPEKKTKAEKHVNPLFPDAPIPEPVHKGSAEVTQLNHIKIIGPAPSPQFLESVRKIGVFQPIILQYKGTHTAKDEMDLGDVRLLAGRRRLAAARIVDGEKASVEVMIPVIIYGRDDVNPHVIAVIENSQRHDNAASELDAIEQMLKSGASEQDVCEATGLSKPQLRGRLKLQSLIPDLRKALNKGTISQTAAERCCALTPAQQAEVLALLGSEGAVTLEDIANLRRVSVAKAAADLPGSMFDTADDDWRITGAKILGDAMLAMPKQTPKKIMEALGGLVASIRESKEGKRAGKTATAAS